MLVSTFAGEGPSGPREPAAEGSKSLLVEDPQQVVVDASGNLYVTDQRDHAIRRIDARGAATTIAGGHGPGLQDGPASESQFNSPNGLSLGPDGSIYVADSLNHRIRRITASGVVETIAGSGPSGMGQGGFADGPALEARFSLPKGLTVAPDGTIYVADTDNARIRAITPEGEVVTLAGTGRVGRADGTGQAAEFSLPSAITLGPDGSLYVTDQPNSAIRRVTPGGEVSTLISSGLLHPASLAVAADRTLYVADSGNHRVVAVSPDGGLRPIAGTGEPGYADGPGLAALFNLPTGIALSGERLYVVDNMNHRIRSIDGVQQ